MQVRTTIALNTRETAFVRALADGNAPSPAAVKAGFGISYARDLISKPHIQMALKSLAENATRAVNIAAAGPVARGPRQ